MNPAPDGDQSRVKSPPSLKAHGSQIVRLPPGTRPASAELPGQVGEGGFSIVYEAWDHSLERRVALKEYMPSSLASRRERSQVHARSARHQETFQAGLKSFVNEGKLLAQFDHPSLVKVYRFWEANGTAYMVMPLYEGVTLKDTVRALPAPPDETWLMGLLDPLTEALIAIHREQCFHRDIAPDNVLLLKEDGRPLLLDFGAARRVIGDKTQALTVILKPGYAPVEQYAEDTAMRQGPWTDVYALASVVHWAILGRTPPVSVARMMSDAYEPLVRAAEGRYSHRLLSAIDAALAVLPEKRTPSIEAFREGLGLSRAIQPARIHRPEVDAERTVLRPAAASIPRNETPAEDGETVLQPLPQPQIQRGDRLDAEDRSTPDHPTEKTLPTEAATPRRRLPLLAAVLVGALVLAAAGTAIWMGREQPPLAAATKSEGVPRAMPSQEAAKPPEPTLSPTATPSAGPSAAPAPAVAEPTLPAPETRPAATANTPAPVREPAAAAITKPATPHIAGNANAAECARILQRVSLGETSADLIERMKTLRCH